MVLGRLDVFDKFDILFEAGKSGLHGLKGLGLVPMWILRNAPGVQFERMRPYNGFILKFKSWIITLGQEPLARDIWNLMRLPVAIWEETPKKLENIFLRQHSRRIS